MPRRTLPFAFIALLIATPAHAGQLPDRWQPGDAPPDIEGIHLGDRRERVAEVLGAPDPNPLPDDPTASFQTLRYRGGALMFAIDGTGCVARILLNRPTGGAIAGIRVGDRLGAMLTAWGEPTTSTAKIGRYQMDQWTISVKADLGTQQILRLMLARTPSPAVAPPAQPSPGAAVP